MKYLIATAAIFAASTASAQVSKVKVYDHTKTVTQSIPVTETRCNDVQVPIYQQSQSNSGDVLLGAILGGLIGGTATGKDSGAAVGAIGGAIIADQNASKPKVSGYRLERQCSDVTIYQNSNVEVYSHSTVRFFLDGKRYVVPFQK
jgi:uncharacterized protein YcfJ